MSLLSLALLTPLRAGTFEPRVTTYPEPTAAPVLFPQKISKPPVIDGKLDDDAWKQAFLIERLGSTSGGMTRLRTTVRVAYDAAHFYVAFDCEEPNLDRVRVKAEAGQDKWPGDCVEVFFDVNRTRQQFLQFVTNSRDAHNDYNNGNISWDGKWKSKSGRTPQGWATEIAIPWTDLGINEAPAEYLWGFNVTRERSLTGVTDDMEGGELSTWMPMESFSNPRLFGLMFFGSREKFASRADPMVIHGTLDKFVYTKLQPLAHLALELTRGEATDSKLNVQICRRVGMESLASATVPLSSSRVGIDLPISALEPGEYRLGLQATDKKGRPSNGVSIDFDIRPAPPVADSGEIAIKQTQVVKTGIDHWHIRTGVPFPEGALWNPEQVELVTADGKSLPVQAQSLATWSKGGSIKWLGLDFQSPLIAGQQTGFTLRFGPKAKHSEAGQVRVEQTDKSITVHTGAAKFEIRKQRFNFLDQMWVGDKQVMASGEERGPFMADEQGNRFWGCLDPNSKVIVEEQGPLKAVVRAEGAHLDARGGSLGRYVVRLYFFSGTPYFRTQHTFIIAEDTNKTRYSDIGLVLPVDGKECRFGGAAEPVQSHAYLLQKKWDEFVVNDLSAASDKKTIAQGAKADGWISAGGLAVTIRDFWQNFPKELEFVPSQSSIGNRQWSFTSGPVTASASGNPRRKSSRSTPTCCRSFTRAGCSISVCPTRITPGRCRRNTASPIPTRTVSGNFTTARRRRTPTAWASARRTTCSSCSAAPPNPTASRR